MFKRSMFKRSIIVEHLETRAMLANDFVLAVHLETLNLDDQPVSRVEVGDMFKLRLSMEDVNPGEYPRLMDGFVDVSFDSEIADIIEEPKFSEGLLGTSFQYDRSGILDDIGGQANGYSKVFASRKPIVQWEVLMKAHSSGEVIFDSNPADILSHIGLFGMAYNYTGVKYGFTRLQVGEELATSASWQNPNDPADVDGDGLANEEDLALIETILGIRPVPEPVVIDREGNVDPATVPSDQLLNWVAMGSSGSVVLNGSGFVAGTAPFLDVDGNGIANAADVIRVKNEIMPELPQWEQHSIFDEDYRLDLSVINLRTGQQVTDGTELLVGDLIRVKLTFPTTDPVYNSFSMAELNKDSHFQETHNVLQVTSQGNFEISFSPLVSNPLTAAAVAGTTPEELIRRIKELLEPHRLSITASESSNRPQAVDHSFSWPQFRNGLSAREVDKLIDPVAKNPAEFSVDADNGILKGVSAETNSRVVLVSPPTTGIGSIDLSSDGSFKYTDSYNSYSTQYDFAVGTQFSYVVVTPTGTSEIRQIKIEPVVLPAIDLQLKVVDANGNKIGLVEVGQEFYVEAHVYSGKIIPEAPWLGAKISPLRFTSQWDNNLALATGEPIVTEVYNGERFRIEEIDGKLSLASDIVKPQVEPKDDGIQATFGHFVLSARLGEDTKLFRQKMVAIEPGTLNLKASNLFFLADGMPDGSVHVDTSELKIIDTSSFVTEFDINQDGIISASDALSIINELNSKRQLESETTEDLLSAAKHTTDVNRDGLVTASDALRVINWLNDKPKRSVMEAEGEASLDQTLTDPLFMQDIDEIIRTKKRSSK